MTSKFEQPVLHNPSFSFIHTLKPEHVGEMLNLQTEILNALPVEERNYIVPKSQEDFEKFTSGTYKAIGIFHEENLVAQTLIAFVTPQDSNKNLTVCDATSAIIDQPDCYGVIEGVLVHPSHRQKGLMKNMVDGAVSLLMQKHDCKRIYSEVAKGNTASMRGFQKNSFNVVAQGIDPSDGCHLFYMQHNALPGMVV